MYIFQTEDCNINSNSVKTENLNYLWTYSKPELRFMEIPCSYGNDDYNKNEYLEHIVQSLNNNTNSAVHNLTHI